MHMTMVFPASLGGASERTYLMVFDGGAAWLYPIRPESTGVIGRGESADLALEQASISRAHAELRARGDAVTITDLESHNGTRVNGVRLTAAHALVAGDVVNVGDVTLVFYREAHRTERAIIVDLQGLRERLSAEIERAIRYDRALCVLVFRHGRLPPGTVEGVAQRLRALDVMARLSEDETALLVPETSPEVAVSLAARLRPLLAEARAGLASFPADGVTPDALVDAARGAARAGTNDGVASPQGAVLALAGERIVVADPAMRRLYSLLERIAASDLALLVTGEIGVGKEVAARALHHWSARRERPFLVANAATLDAGPGTPSLFGDDRSNAPGLLDQVAGGTLMIDAVGDLPQPAQQRLLLALESGKHGRPGAERRLDVRLVGTTDHDLGVDVGEGRLRKDLYVRLSAATLALPPLRDRPRDLAPLAREFLAAACARAGRPAITLHLAALEALSKHVWPGNVRELRNLMDYLASVAQGPVVEAHQLPDRFREAQLGEDDGHLDPPPLATGHPPNQHGFQNIYDEVRALEEARMRAALRASGGVRKRAAELIGMPLRTFAAKSRQYDIQTQSLGPRRRR